MRIEPSPLSHDSQASIALVQARQQLADKAFPRKEVVASLHSYNQKIGNDELALQNVQSLSQPDSACVITGQQLGFMGGPAYTVLKGISCLLVAKEAGAVPIFWLATEDHDVAEINHAELLDDHGNIQKFHLSMPRGMAIEDIPFTSQNREVMEQFCAAVNLTLNIPTTLTSYAEIMAHVLVRLFAGTGMVFLEPRLLRPLAKRFFKKEVQASQQIQQILAQTTERLLAAGGQAPIAVGEGSNLFLKTENKKRQKLLDGEYALAEILDLIEREPERFSPNVAARPVLQSLLLPTLAYVAGPSEIAYHAQLGDYFRFHGVSMPCIIPRLSATMIPPEAADLLTKLGVTPWEKLPAHTSAIPAQGLHLLNNLLHPQNKPQERVFNWWGFQAHSQGNLLQECLQKLSWRETRHLYIYL